MTVSLFGLTPLAFPARDNTYRYLQTLGVVFMTVLLVDCTSALRIFSPLD